MTCLKAPLNCSKLGLCLKPPLPLITEKRFSTQSWFNLDLFVSMKLNPFPWSSSQIWSKLEIDICHPTRQGTHSVFFVFSCDKNLKQLSRNCTCLLLELIACLNLWLLVIFALLKQLDLKSSSKVSTNSAVAEASFGMCSKAHKVLIPAATEWLKSWAARLTLIAEKGGNETCFSVRSNFGAILTENIFSKLKNSVMYFHLVSTSPYWKPFFIKLFLTFFSKCGGSHHIHFLILVHKERPLDWHLLQLM